MLLQKRTEILVEGDFAVFWRLAEKIAEDSEVKVTCGPETILVMKGLKVEYGTGANDANPRGR